MYPAGPKSQVDFAQNLDRPEAFRDPAKLNYRSHRAPFRIDIVQVPRPGDVSVLS